MELQRETDKSTLTVSVTNTPPAVNGAADRKSVRIARLEQHHRST